MVYSFVRKKHFSTTKPNIIPIENFSIFISKQEKGEIGKKILYTFKERLK